MKQHGGKTTIAAKKYFVSQNICHTIQFQFHAVSTLYLQFLNTLATDSHHHPNHYHQCYGEQR